MSSKVLVMRTEKGCMCSFCAEYQMDKFAEIMACKCYCHVQGYAGHDRLCCSLPNVVPLNHTKVIDLVATNKGADDV